MALFMKPLTHLHHSKTELRATRKQERTERRLHRRYLRAVAINAFVGNPLLPSFDEWRQGN